MLTWELELWGAIPEKASLVPNEGSLEKAILGRGPLGCWKKPRATPTWSFNLIPLPSPRPNTLYEPTLPRLPAQPPRPAGADGAQILQGPGLPPGATAWREAAVRKACGIYHRCIIAQAKKTLPRHQLWRPKGPCSWSSPHHKGGPWLLGWGAPSARLLQGAGRTEKENRARRKVFLGFFTQKRTVLLANFNALRWRRAWVSPTPPTRQQPAPQTRTPQC